MSEGEEGDGKDEREERHGRELGEIWKRWEKEERKEKREKQRVRDREERKSEVSERDVKKKSVFFDKIIFIQNHMADSTEDHSLSWSSAWSGYFGAYWIGELEVLKSTTHRRVRMGSR